ncbi:MAG: ferric reductase-like transmembrane domain-containing protein [Candidatus Izemoplasmatales bacterium]
MLIIPFVIIIAATGYFLSDKIKKYKIYLYIISSLIGILVLIFSKSNITLPFNQGFIGFSFFYVVMITGLFNKESKIFKRLFKVRPQLSIIGFILLSPHAIYYLIERITENYLPDSRIIAIAFFIGILAYLIMIPLFITSFKVIENKKQFFKWKKLQKFAYFIYLAIFLHLVFVAKMPNLIIYLILFIPYFIYKPIHFIKHEIPSYKKMHMTDSLIKANKK